MINQMLNRFKQYRKIVGLEVFIKPDQNYVFNLIILEKIKDKIEIIDRRNNITSIEAIQKIEDISSLPFALILNGKSVLNKKINNPSIDANSVIASIIPNANAEEFSYQIYLSEGFNWVSIIRKEILESIIKTFSDAGLSIVDLSLGVFSVESILPLMSGHTNIQIHASKLEIENDKIIAVSKNESIGSAIKYNIGTDELSQSLLLAFSKAFTRLVQIPSEIYNVDIIAKEEENYIYTNLFQKLKWGGLIGVFSLLLINFMLFNHLNNKNQATGVQLSMHQNQLLQLDELKKEYQKKQLFFKQTSVLKPSRVSWYADQITASIKEGIQLQQLEVAPPINKKRRKIDRQFIFDNRKILIKGNSRKSTHLNNWINRLQYLDWIETINVLPYSEGRNGRGEFELELILSSLENK